ncbi:unannotated protein [freshwater metagenome]|uniref:Unannotated protein n=1 Tax=freshwater metagenome TaxID=449393 RepID=A0A6J7C1W9_9ZZZZ
MSHPGVPHGAIVVGSVEPDAVRPLRVPVQALHEIPHAVVVLGEEARHTLAGLRHDAHRAPLVLSRPVADVPREDVADPQRPLGDGADRVAHPDVLEPSWFGTATLFGEDRLLDLLDLLVGVRRGVDTTLLSSLHARRPLDVEEPVAVLGDRRAVGFSGVLDLAVGAHRSRLERLRCLLAHVREGLAHVYPIARSDGGGEPPVAAGIEHADTGQRTSRSLPDVGRHRRRRRASQRADVERGADGRAPTAGAAVVGICIQRVVVAVAVAEVPHRVGVGLEVERRGHLHRNTDADPHLLDALIGDAGAHVAVVVSHSQIIVHSDFRHPDGVQPGRSPLARLGTVGLGDHLQM